MKVNKNKMITAKDYFKVERVSKTGDKITMNGVKYILTETDEAFLFIDLNTGDPQEFSKKSSYKNHQQILDGYYKGNKITYESHDKDVNKDVKGAIFYGKNKYFEGFFNLTDTPEDNYSYFFSGFNNQQQLSMVADSYTNSTIINYEMFCYLLDSEVTDEYYYVCEISELYDFLVTKISK